MIQTLYFSTLKLSDLFLTFFLVSIFMRIILQSSSAQKRENGGKNLTTVFLEFVSHHICDDLLMKIFGMTSFFQKIREETLGT